MNDDYLRDRLDAWGHSSTPPVNDRFADTLESELRVRAGQRVGATPRPIWQPIAGLVAASVLVVAGFVAVNRTSPGNGRVVVLATSQDSTVILPDGTELDSPTALDLPDGTRIEVGADGSANIDSVVLGAGSVAEIIDGRVEILSQPSDRTASTTTPTTSTPPSTQPTTSSPPTTVRPTTTGQVDRTTSTPPSTRPTTSSPARAEVVLSATQLSRSEVLLEWTATRTDQIRGWEVQLRDGDRSATIALVREPAARRLTVTRPDQNSPSYVVVGLDRNGNAVAESNPARVG